MVRPLPSAQEALRILAARRTRPPPRPPPAAARGLAKTLKGLDAKFGHGLDGIAGRWTEIVGKTLARRTEPAKLVRPRAAGAGQVLEIRVDGPSATLIQHQAQDIIVRVNLFLGPGAVERLRIVQGPLRGHKGRPVAVAARRRGRGPLDAAAERRLEESLAAFPEGPLKSALTRLGREVLRAEQG